MTTPAPSPMPATAVPRLGVLVSGRGSNFAAILAAIEQGELRATVAIVISSKPEVPALAIAAAQGIPSIVLRGKDFPDRAAEGRAIITALRAASVDLVVTAGYGRIVDPIVLEAYRWRIINIHPSLLPAFAGTMAPGPQAAALASGVKFAGCTTHFVTEDTDAGPIIMQAVVPVHDADTVESLADRILQQEHRIFPASIAAVLSGNLRIVGRRVVGHQHTEEGPDARDR